VNFGITRIGVHAGPALVGNFGGSRFFDYPAYGDTINAAARLEAVNKYWGTRIRTFRTGHWAIWSCVAAASRCVPMSLCRRMPSRRRR